MAQRKTYEERLVYCVELLKRHECDWSVNRIAHACGLDPELVTVIYQEYSKERAKRREKEREKWKN